MSREGFLRVESAEVDIKIFPAVVNIERLEDTKFVARCSRRCVRNIILN